MRGKLKPPELPLAQENWPTCWREEVRNHAESIARGLQGWTVRELEFLAVAVVMRRYRLERAAEMVLASEREHLEAEAVSAALICSERF